MSELRTADSRVGRWSMAALVTVVLAAGAGACGADSNVGADRGAAIYGANCASCHGAALQGTELGPSLLDPVYAPDQLSDDQFRSAVRNGVEENRWEFGPMPANGGLGDGQIDAMLGFVRAAQGAAATVTVP